ncbi:TetR/AcrR family transcriptional regulator [Clostridium sp. KNHs214]|uniref:TetR/AcrR family transcriptional regulator n=1 Tax=Clostridium sp. KNHs214 TaxID=1540257 RepID=UPI0009DD0774|nr:TetR/AcrR family transcriptional regulator [Clostridium sp. KNHs214]
MLNFKRLKETFNGKSEVGEKPSLKRNKRKENKTIKRNSLYDAAYELFITKGINNTAIDDIVKKAGVAKGTFYLYFKDKYDIFDKIILKKSSVVIKEAMSETEKNKEKFDDFIEAIIFFINYLIEYFKNNKMLLKLIHKNLSWGIYRKAVYDIDTNEDMKRLVDIFMRNINSGEYDIEDSGKTLFIILELTSSICYSGIILEEPDNIDNMKPVLFKSIRKILTK